MKTISIHQPWAWAILHAGKSVENRTWPTRYRGPLLIHASKSRASYDREADGWQQTYGVPLPSWKSLPNGAIVGVVELIDCLFLEDGGRIAEEYALWAEGPVCWVLKNPRAFAEPIPYRGAQGLFDVPDELIRSTLASVR